MKEIKKIIKEIEGSLKAVDLLVIFIKSMVMLVAFYLVLFVIGVDPFLAVIPTIVYLLSSLFMRSRIDYLRKVESRYEGLDEKLRTARDHKNKDNIILEALESEIIQNLRSVRVSAFFPYKNILLLSIILVVVVVASLLIASNDIRVVDFDSIMADAIKMFEQQEAEEIQQADFTGAEESIMKVGNEKIEVEINPVGIDFDFNQVEEDADYDFSTSFPKDIFISSGAAYESEFTDEQQVLIKRYFDNVKG